MTQPILKLDRKQILNLLIQFPEDELKNIFNDLLRLKLYKPPKFYDISNEIKGIVKNEKLNPEIIDEAIRWSRRQK